MKEKQGDIGYICREKALERKAVSKGSWWCRRRRKRKTMRGIDQLRTEIEEEKEN